MNYQQEYKRYKRYFQGLTQTYTKRPAVQTSIELTLTLLTISFFVVFAIRPTIGAIAELISEIQTQKIVEEKLDLKLANLQKANLIWSKNKSRALTLLDQALPTDPAPAKLIQQLEALAGQTRINIQTLSIQKMSLFGKSQRTDTRVGMEKNRTEENLPSHIKTFRITLTLQGSYNALMQFLQELENLRRVNTPMSLTMGNSVEDTTTLNLAISVSVPYYQK